MGQHLRQDQLQALAELPVSAHVCHFYEKDIELAEASSAFLGAGLASGASCLWLLDPPWSVGAAWECLASTIPGLEGYRAQGQIEVIPAADWFLTAGSLDVTRASQQCDRRLETARAGGHGALRIAAGTAWLSRRDWETFCGHEQRLTDTLAERPLATLCAHSLAARGPGDVLDVLRTHQLATVTRRGRFELMQAGALARLRPERESLEGDLSGRERMDALEATVESLRAELGRQRELEDTIRRAQSALGQTNRALTVRELTAWMVRELEAPLSALSSSASSGSIGLRRQRPDVAEATAAMDRILEESRRAEAVVDNLRARLGPGETVRTPLVLNDLIREVITLAEPELRRRGVTLSTDLDESLPPVTGDRAQLAHLVLELALNGVQAIASAEDDSPRQLVISTGLRDQRTVVVEVRDAGVGFGEINTARLFEPFFTTKPNGLGLGLTLCRSIVSAHGGHLWATPNADRGATFHLTLPVAPPQTARP
jgi:signal transduction histidine kinase